MKNIKVMYSRNTDHWSTPKYIYDTYMKMGYFDPCPLNSTFNGLQINWKKYNFVNPPYSITSKFVDKAIQENKLGKEVIFLIPARTDTKYFHKLLDHNAKVFFIKGRLKFGNSKTAPFPSIFVLLQGNML
jgi:site-specific DNA-methyltransferase (adenine-specific)